FGRQPAFRRSRQNVRAANSCEPADRAVVRASNSLLSIPKFSAVQRHPPSGETRKNASRIYNGRTRRPGYYCTVTREVMGPRGATPGARSKIRAPVFQRSADLRIGLRPEHSTFNIQLPTSNEPPQGPRWTFDVEC